MADKSFGDYTNRNVVKNPLLSSAVTGLSIEDLTHNAVLLPAVPTQEPLLRQDQHEHQMPTLRYSDQESSNIPSGDAKNITTSYNSPLNLNPNPQNTQKYDLTFNTHENPSTTLSKATPKSDDDFDVNEYFARLQGTRYVSAPLNSSLKEDQNANLQTEENLEEINLNEPDKAQNDDVQHSLTADIAQNFSQLPTVLPQVASAVFSSFSNMLNYKSREQTPDDGKVYQEAPKFEVNMPVVTEVVDAAPPPLKEPPSGIASSYRITTKKKVYAQIPGLSSRDNQHIQTFNAPPSNVAPPNYFIPESNVNLPYAENKPENISIGLPPQTSLTEVETDSQNKNYPKTDEVKSSYNLFNPIPLEEKGKSSDIQAEFFIPSQATEVILPKQEPPLDTANQLITPGSAPIIPPPPMFSNVRRDSQSAVGKSFLPPSVARRISGAHPVIKPQASPNVIPHGNIFIPTIPDPDNSFGTNTTDTQNFVPPATHSSEPIQTLYDIPVMGKQEMISQNDKQTDISTSLNKLQPTQICDLTPNTMTAFKASTNIPVTDTTVGSSGISTESLFSSHQATSFDATIIPTMTYPVGTEHTRMQLGMSSIFQQPSTQSINEQPTIAPPLFFNPNALQTDIHASIKAQNPIPEKQVTEYFSNNAPSEPPKPLPVPPKVTGNQNYRMSKKRPQYYSGPIDGVGSISNNVKPLINPVEPTFSGALFTPDQCVPIATNTMQPGSDISAMQEPAPFDINTPIKTGYPMYNTQPEIPDHNTAFDLNRSSIENYEQTQQEYKGFGIIGSLKSKLGSLDINKIQSKVTTFFDPAYNDTKVDDTVKQESNLYSQHLSGINYSKYPQNDETTLEVFVPSMDQGQSVMSTQTYSGEYTQSIDQNQHYYQYNDYFGNQSQNLTNQDTNYYPVWQDNYNQQQSSSSYYQNPANIVQDITLDNSSSIIHESSKNEIVSQKKIDNISSVKTSDEQLINKKQDIPFQVPNVTQPVDVLQFFHQERALEKKNEDTTSQSNTGAELKSFFDQNIHSGFDSMKFQKDEFKQDSKLLPQTEIPSSQSSSIQNIVNNPQSVLKTKSNTGLVTDIPEKFFSDLPKISQDSSSKGFFDKDTPIVLPFEAKKLEENINKRKLREEIEASKIAHPKPVHVLKPTVIKGNSNDFIDYNKSYINLAQNKDDISTIKIPALKDMAIGILPPEALKGEDEVKEYTMFGSETSTFSLFEPSSNVPSIPLFGLSSMSSISLSSPTESKDIKNIEKKMESISLLENTDAIVFAHNTSSIFGTVGSDDPNKELLEEPISDLNICETCREVNKPEEKEVEDLTTQLIENITAPIQLANPVEYPVIEDPLVNKKDYEGSFASVPQTEDIIETMKLPTPLDLIDEISNNNAILNYGWSTNEGHSSKVLLDHNYGFQDNSLFFETMPTNASDEIKAGYKNTEEDSSILPRQLSIPTAPPEEDTKSDESGLDVHSIEQDATKDFPIYEEFVIEPSETDDGKIEYRERELSLDGPEETVDTFTGRVERYKKMENSTELNDSKFNIKKEFKSFNLPTSTSPAITIASYFDTGNYAVENHYKNSLTSPSTLNSFNTSTNTPKVPPGFEEVYQRRLSQNISSIYDVNKPHTTVKLITIQPQGEDSLCDDSVETMINELIQEDAPIEDIPIKTDQMPLVASFVEPKQEKVEDKKEANINESMIEEEHKLESLPDPINFFSSNDDTTQQSDTFNNFSRLSSYFTTPPKPDHSKSFFELSQSQNHYRHKPSENNIDVIQNKVKKFFENSNLNSNSIDSNKNIPQNIMHTMSLVNDLTSIENIGPNKDLVITTNYFTVEPSNNIVQEINITESIKNQIKEELNDHVQNNINARDIDLTSFDNIVRSCNRCSHKTEKLKIDNSTFKVRRSMDNNTENKETNMESKKDGAKKSLTVNFFEQTQTVQEDADDKIVVISENRATSEYSPVKHHWFYKVENEEKSLWRGFSVTDSRALETAYNSADLNENTLVPTDGGRYDVNIMARLKTAVYWTDKPANVMRCSWFYKGTTDARYVPYTEDIAEKLEEEYRHGITTGEWHRRLMLENNELVVMHGPAVMVHFLQTPVTDTFGTSPQSMTRPRVVRRGCIDSEIEDTEPSSIDHLLLLCHGVGSACDMRFRPVEEVVDDFRATSLQLIQSHYKNSYDNGLVGRVEVLPISWHSSLHSGTGVDKRLAAITLESIPRLRNFTNDTILDVLFYTSPVFCQTIIDTVCSELNRIYKLFKLRNPDFKGGVSLGGHSLGSVILYDLLCHQLPVDSESQTKHLIKGNAGTGQPCVEYPRLGFSPDALYALGSPIAIFECIRGVESLGLDFCLPTCKNFFNIFHPYDPIAYRIEPMVNPQLRDVKPFLIPHHKGRKRMHLELKETMARVGADIKQKLIESIKNTWSSMWKTQPPSDRQLEKVVEEEMEKEQLTAESKEENADNKEITPEMLGRLNDGRRVDHVLQEAPFEMINEYLFAMSSHVVYWESEDTMLVMLREIYNAIGVSPDCCLPQNTMTVERHRVHENPIMTSPESPSTSRGGT